MPSKMVLDRHRREKSLRGLVKELRGKTVEGVTELVDVRGPTARAHHRDRLMSQVRRALDSLRDPATKIPEPRKGVELPADLKQRWIGNLETARTRLQDALDELEAGEREKGRARHKKGARIELHDDEVSAIAKLQESLLILGRKPEAARIIWEKQRPVGRPTRRKKRKRGATKQTTKQTGKRSQATTTSQTATANTAHPEMSSREVAKS